MFSFVFEAIRGRKLSIRCVCFNPRVFGRYGALSKVKQCLFVIFEFCFFCVVFASRKESVGGFGALIRERECVKPETQSRISSFGDKEIK